MPHTASMGYCSGVCLTVAALLAVTVGRTATDPLRQGFKLNCLLCHLRVIVVEVQPQHLAPYGFISTALHGMEQP